MGDSTDIHYLFDIIIAHVVLLGGCHRPGGALVHGHRESAGSHPTPAAVSTAGTGCLRICHQSLLKGVPAPAPAFGLPLVGNEFGQVGGQMSDVLSHLNSGVSPLEMLLEARVLLQEHGRVGDSVGKAILRSKKLSFTTLVG